MKFTEIIKKFLIRLSVNDRFVLETGVCLNA